MLVQSKLNAPFSGGLSSYSAFLLVLAVYDRCQYSEDRQPLFTRRRGTGTGSSTIVPESLSGGYSDIEDSSSNDRIENTAAGAGSVPTLPVTEGEVFLHFLTFYALSSSTFNPLTQGIGKYKKNNKEKRFSTFYRIICFYLEHISLIYVTALTHFSILLLFFIHLFNFVRIRCSLW